MIRLFKQVFLFAVILSLLFVPPVYSENSDDSSQPRNQQNGFNIGRFLVSMYSRHISPVDSDRCPSFPSCSSYSSKCFKKHGFFMGWMMTVDRLIHEGGEEAEVSDLIQTEGKWKIYDPVENNDFWWHSNEEDISK